MNTRIAWKWLKEERKPRITSLFIPFMKMKDGDTRFAMSTETLLKVILQKCLFSRQWHVDRIRTSRMCSCDLMYLDLINGWPNPVSYRCPPWARALASLLVSVIWREVSYGEVVRDKSNMHVRVTLYWGYLMYCVYFIWCVSCTVVVLTCFVMCVCVCVCVCVL
jgi:hypothetical protein